VIVVYRTYAGDRLDLQIFKARLVNGYEIEIFNNDDTVKDLSVYSNIVLEILQKQHGTLVEEFETGAGIQITGNVISWSADDEQTDLRPKFYASNCYGVLPEGKELIFNGVIEVI